MLDESILLRNGGRREAEDILRHHILLGFRVGYQNGV